MRSTVMRSWPWTIALAAVLGGFVLVGLVGLGLRTSVFELLISIVVTTASVLGFVRALAMGVRTTPTGLAIRELTRTTLIPWDRVRNVTSEQTAQRRSVFAPVLHLGSEKAVKGARRGRSGLERFEVTVLGSYKADVAQRRADQLSRALAESRSGPGGRLGS